MNASFIITYIYFTFINSLKVLQIKAMIRFWIANAKLNDP